MSTEHVIVDKWPSPIGYANGRIGHGRVLHIAGQIGWNAHGKFETTDFVEQFAKALDNVLMVVHQANGRATDIAAMTVYVTDMEDYRARRKELGPVWKLRLQNHFPTMAVVGVSSLVERAACVEISAVAYLEHDE
jgi:enamine deaminase RidA (YjgF/YER057c/UK114 family)